MANEAVLSKQAYKAQCEERLAQKRKDIEVLNQKLKTLVPGSAEYNQCQLDITKAEKKATEFAQSIYMMDVQMNLKTHPAYASVPTIVQITH